MRRAVGVRDNITARARSHRVSVPRFRSGRVRCWQSILLRHTGPITRLAEDMAFRFPPAGSLNRVYRLRYNRQDSDRSAHRDLPVRDQVQRTIDPSALRGRINRNSLCGQDVADLSISQNGYRLRRYYLIVGIIGVIVSSAAAVGSAYAAFCNTDGAFAHPIRAAIAYGSFWSVFTLLGVWILLAYSRECLLLDGAQITQHGVIRSKVIHFNDVMHIKWRRIPQGGSVVIRTLTDRLTIYFDNFTVEERQQLISYLHGKFSPDLQEGWSRFEDCNLHVTPHSIQRSRSRSVIRALILFSFAGIFSYRWVAGLGVTWLFIGIANAVAGLCHLWRIVTFANRAPNDKSA